MYVCRPVFLVDELRGGVHLWGANYRQVAIALKFIYLLSQHLINISFLQIKLHNRPGSRLP